MTSNNIFDGVTIDWGFTSGDVLTSGMALVGALGAFVLIGVAIGVAPRLISLIKGAIGRGGKSNA